MAQQCLVRCFLENSSIYVKYIFISSRNKIVDDEQFALIMKEEFRVCAEHFTESDFDARGKLRNDAVPSRFPWNGGFQKSTSQTS